MPYNTHQEACYRYIILCDHDSYYTGHTDDLLNRFEEYLQGVYEGCYTALRQPLQLKHNETIPFLQDALDRVRQLKGGSKAKKQALIEGNFHKLQLPAECQNSLHRKYKAINDTGSIAGFAKLIKKNLNFAQHKPKHDEKNRYSRRWPVRTNVITSRSQLSC